MGYTSKKTRASASKALRSGKTKAQRSVGAIFMNQAKKDKKRKKT